MKVITNKGRRRLGVPGRPALILDPGQSASVDSQQLESFRRNRTVSRWLEAGVLVLSDEVGVVEVPKPQPKVRPGIRVAVERDKRVEEVLPEGVTGQGVEISQSGGGWYQVYVNGFKVTDRNVRKDEAESISAEYE